MKDANCSLVIISDIFHILTHRNLTQRNEAIVENYHA